MWSRPPLLLTVAVRAQKPHHVRLWIPIPLFVWLPLCDILMDLAELYALFGKKQTGHASPDALKGYIRLADEAVRSLLTASGAPYDLVRVETEEAFVRIRLY